MTEGKAIKNMTSAELEQDRVFLMEEIKGRNQAMALIDELFQNLIHDREMLEGERFA